MCSQLLSHNPCILSWRYRCAVDCRCRQNPRAATRPCPHHVPQARPRGLRLRSLACGLLPAMNIFAHKISPPSLSCRRYPRLRASLLPSRVTSLFQAEPEHQDHRTPGLSFTSFTRHAAFEVGYVHSVRGRRFAAKISQDFLVLDILRQNTDDYFRCGRRRRGEHSRISRSNRFQTEIRRRRGG